MPASHWVTVMVEFTVDGKVSRKDAVSMVSTKSFCKALSRLIGAKTVNHAEIIDLGRIPSYKREGEPTEKERNKVYCKLHDMPTFNETYKE